MISEVRIHWDGRTWVLSTRPDRRSRWEAQCSDRDRRRLLSAAADLDWFELEVHQRAHLEHEALRIAEGAAAEIVQELRQTIAELVRVELAERDS